MNVDIEGVGIELVPIRNQPCIENELHQIYCLDVHRIDPSPPPLLHTTPTLPARPEEEGEGGIPGGDLDWRAPTGPKEGEGGVGGGDLDRRTPAGPGEEGEGGVQREQHR